MTGFLGSLAPFAQLPQLGFNMYQPTMDIVDASAFAPIGDVQLDDLEKPTDVIENLSPLGLQRIGDRLGDAIYGEVGDTCSRHNTIKDPAINFDRTAAASQVGRQPMRECALTLLSMVLGHGIASSVALKGTNQDEFYRHPGHHDVRHHSIERAAARSPAPKRRAHPPATD
jgi:hypothetical protein